MVGKSLLINTTERLKRVSVTDPSVADALVVTPTQVLVNGLAPGEISLLIWDEAERSQSFDLRVDVDVTAAAEEVRRLFPDEQISITPSRSAIVLSGHVTTEDVAKHAGAIASAYSKNVVNVLSFGPVGAQEVLLEVKFAEVDRTAVLQLGANLFMPGLGNTIALSQTGQFGSLNVTNTAQTTVTNGNTQTTTTTATPPVVHISDFLNLFIARSDINIGAVIRALQQKNLLQILAEPNLIAVNGKEASSYSTSGAIFSLQHYIARMSAYVTLWPGDVIWLGCDGPTLPALEPGDLVEVVNEAIGVLANRVARG